MVLQVRIELTSADYKSAVITIILQELFVQSAVLEESFLPMDFYSNLPIKCDPEDF